MTYVYPFRMTSTTGTVVLIDPLSQEVVTGVRKDGAWVYPNFNSLCGGFMEARYTEADETAERAQSRRAADRFMDAKYMADMFHEGEDAETCMIREIREELGVEIQREQLILFAARTNSRTDTRAHVSNICFYVVLTPQQSALLPHGRDVSDLDDLKEVRRTAIRDIPEDESLMPMAFNHHEVMLQGLAAWRKEVRRQEQEGEIQRLRTLVSQLENEARATQEILHRFVNDDLTGPRVA